MDAGTIWIITLAALYFLPIMIVTFSEKRHRNMGAVIVVNIVAGWTFIGWVVALVWAVMDSQYDQVEKTPGPEPINYLDPETRRRRDEARTP